MRTKFYSTDLFKEIHLQMQMQQKLSSNYIDSTKNENLRTNFITWLYRLATKTEVLNETLFNTISILDELCGLVSCEIINDSSNFQLLAITCFFLSYKAFEKKAMTIAFVEKYLLCNKWKEEDIRRAEIFVLETLDYRIHSINFYSFYQFFEIIINKHFTEEKVRQIKFLVNFTMKQALYIKEIIFGLIPSEQTKLILNTVFLLEQQLTGLDLSEYEAFFIEVSSVSSGQETSDFQKYSSLLIQSLRLTEDFVRNFAKIQ